MSDMRLREEIRKLDELEAYLKFIYDITSERQDIDVITDKRCVEARKKCGRELMQPSFFLRQGNIGRVQVRIQNGGISYEKASQMMKTSEAEQNSFYDEKGELPEDLNIKLIRHLRYWAMESHSHEFIEIAYMLEGQCTHSFYIGKSEKQTFMKKGSVLIIPPGLRHKIEIFDDSVMVNILVRTETFYKVFLSNFPEDNTLFKFFTNVLYSDKKNDYIMLHTDANDILEDLILQMFVEIDARDKYTREICDRYLEIWFLKVLLHQNDFVESSVFGKSNIDAIVISIILYIETYYETATLAGIVEEFHFSSTYLNKLFKKETGLTVQKYITKTKVEKAYDMVTKTDMAIGDIGEKIGYQDTSYFIEQFKNFYGKTPLQVRKESLK